MLAALRRLLLASLLAPGFCSAALEYCILDAALPNLPGMVVMPAGVEVCAASPSALMSAMVARIQSFGRCVGGPRLEPGETVFSTEWSDCSPQGQPRVYFTITVREASGGGGGACTQGARRVINVTTGWARGGVRDVADYVYHYPLPFGVEGGSCDGSCSYTVPVTADALGQCFRSGVPGSNGLHRVSCDVNVAYTGASCSSATPEASSATPNPPCPGVLGYVNGRPTCVGSAPGGLPAASSPTGHGSQGQGNPAAGAMPTAGPGSGFGSRTPAAGNGGNDGGGSDASSSPSGSGGGPSTVDVTVETCGLPGKPPCKLDESGTPGADGAFGTATGVLNGAMDQLGGVYASARVAEVPSWMWVVPTGACTPLSQSFRLGELTVDPCTSPLVALWRQVLAFALYVLAALYMWRSVVRGWQP